MVITEIAGRCIPSLRPICPSVRFRRCPTRHDSEQGTNGEAMTPEQHAANNHEPVTGIDGVLCPVCGEVVKELPVLVQRTVGDGEERFRVCSAGCREDALRSRHLQMNLFARDLTVWSRSRQAALDLPDRDDGDGSGEHPQGDDSTKSSA